MREGEVASPGPGEKLTCIRSAAQGGAFVFELELGPGRKGPPMHSHDECDEIVEVIRGEIVFRVGGEDKLLRPGDRLTLRPDEPHTFWNPSKSEAVTCRVTHGGRFEQAIAQPDFTSLAMYLTLVDPGASRVANPMVRAVLRLVAAFGRLRGRRPITAPQPAHSR